MNMEIDLLREFLKDDIRDATNFAATDQNRGIPAPPIEKTVKDGQEIVSLPAVSRDTLTHNDLFDAIVSRKSWRKYRSAAISQEELAWLLFAAQGIPRPERTVKRRTVPSAGNRHSFETYVAVFDVAGLDAGIYRYLATRNALVKESAPEHLRERVVAATRGQVFAGNGALCLFFTTLPYRTEWRYAEASHKVIAQDSGHVVQNVYLAVAAIDCGTCAVAAYDQRLADELLGVDGNDEFTVYVAPVGKI